MSGYIDKTVADIGLLPGDVLDALVLSDERPGINIPNGSLDPGGTDVALFSLQASSPTLTAFNFHPGDVFYTDFRTIFSDTNRKLTIYADNLALGLDDDDELNALDIKPTVPEPSSALSLLALGLFGLGSRGKWRKNFQSSEKEKTNVG